MVIGLVVGCKFLTGAPYITKCSVVPEPLIPLWIGILILDGFALLAMSLSLLEMDCVALHVAAVLSVLCELEQLLCMTVVSSF